MAVFPLPDEQRGPLRTFNSPRLLLSVPAKIGAPVRRFPPEPKAGIHSRNNRTSAFSATRRFPMSSSGQCMASSSVQMTR